MTSSLFEINGKLAIRVRQEKWLVQESASEASFLLLCQFTIMHFLCQHCYIITLLFAMMYYKYSHLHHTVVSWRTDNVIYKQAKRDNPIVWLYHNLLLDLMLLNTFVVDETRSAIWQIQIEVSNTVSRFLSIYRYNTDLLIEEVQKTMYFSQSAIHISFIQTKL